jgi:hypothetical protein
MIGCSLALLRPVVAPQTVILRDSRKHPIIATVVSFTKGDFNVDVRQYCAYL